MPGPTPWRAPLLGQLGGLILGLFAAIAALVVERGGQVVDLASRW